MSRVDDLLAELTTERDVFLDALEDVDAELVTVPGVVGDWSVRDLIAHVAFWAEHATEALRLATDGRGDAFAYDISQTDAMNARLLEESRQMRPDVAIEREDHAFAALSAALAALDPALLDLRLGNGDTVADVIRYDGAEHYREHAAHVRAWFDEPDRED